jgi:uncharacterized protein YgiM (DUF1202 family)
MKNICLCLCLFILLISCKKNNNENQNIIGTTIDNVEMINDNIETGSSEIQINQALNKTMYINASGGLRVRNLPSVDGERIGLLDYSTQVTITREENNNVIIDGIEGKWVYIKADNIEGWVFSGYLSDRIELDQKKYEFKIRNINVRMTDNQVLSILGNPSHIEFEENYDKNGFGYIYWYYNGIKLHFWDGRKLDWDDVTLLTDDVILIQIELITNKYSTYRGLKIGDSINRLLELYPEAEGRNGNLWDEVTNSSKTVYFYNFDITYKNLREEYETQSLLINYKENIVTEIFIMDIYLSDQYGNSLERWFSP